VEVGGGGGVEETGKLVPQPRLVGRGEVDLVQVELHGADVLVGGAVEIVDEEVASDGRHAHGPYRRGRYYQARHPTSVAPVPVAGAVIPVSGGGFAVQQRGGPLLQFGDSPVDVGEGVADIEEVLQVLAALGPCPVPGGPPGMHPLSPPASFDPIWRDFFADDSSGTLAAAGQWPQGGAGDPERLRR
jgi:hypothetical protein